MKKKKEIIGIIPSKVIFQAEKPRYSVSFRTGCYLSEKDRPRKKYSKKEYYCDRYS